ncbi:hypothetical protein [Pontibacter populi]|uniref:Uncharacterized protein n=1 Tax=Pontibacter populi TaxID=890055 RepID=A0ABV1RPX0_9BACT
MKYILLTLFVAFSFIADVKAQSDFAEWNKNYPKVDILKVLNWEQHYADSIDATKGKREYYTRFDKYSFSATYLGEKRTIDSKVMKSMGNVFKLFGGDASQLNSMVENEYLFQVGELTFWAPIQKQLEKPLKKEVKKGATATLYCLFLNEHSSNGLFNTLLISEFNKN